jgi:hypothetical protein
MVEYYMTYKYVSKSKPRLIVFIYWTNQVSENDIGLKTFKNFETKQFIDVCVINYCVEFLKINNLYYVINKKVNNPDDGDLYITEEKDE